MLSFSQTVLELKGFLLRERRMQADRIAATWLARIDPVQTVLTRLMRSRPWARLFCPTRSVRPDPHRIDITNEPNDTVISVARARFRRAVRRVIHLLLLRRKWSAYGKILQRAPNKSLFVGLDRIQGKLVRVSPAPA